MNRAIRVAAMLIASLSFLLVGCETIYSIPFIFVKTEAPKPTPTPHK